MAKKRTKVLGFSFILFFGVLVLLAVLYLQVKLYSPKKEVSKTSVAPSPLVLKPISGVLASTSPSAEPKIASVPVSSGRSVNVPILMYHYIGNNPNPADKARNSLSTAPDKFDEQMGFLASQGFTPITFDELYPALKRNSSLPAKPIVLTFDDGYVDFYVNAFPILRKYNFHAVSFIPTGLMNQGYYLTWSEIKEMQSSGLISFEAHSVNHVNLALLSGDRLKYQVQESKKVLEGVLGTPVNFFAYPYGTSNTATWEAVKEAGFAGAVGTWSGSIESEGTQYDWPRIRINGGISLETFKRII